MPDAVAILDRGPEWLRRMAYRVAAGRGLLGRAVDIARFRFTKDEIPPLPAPGGEPVRLLIGPANSAGQGYRWSHAVEESLPGVSATSMYAIGSDPFRPEIDLRVPVAVYQRSREWHEGLEQLLMQMTHVLWESGLPLLGRRYPRGVSGEMELLRAHGVHGGLLFHGSDIRPPDRHAEQNPWSPFRSRSGAVRALEETTATNAALAARSGAPLFVSTPDLLQWVPGATWFPVVVDVDRWRLPTARAESAGRLVVAHAPSQRWLKGTDLIEPTLERLDAEGVIEYRQVLGVPHASMPAFYADADVVLDQFVLGIYGVAACEALASGRIVMSHVDDFTRSEVRERTGLELPIHETTAATLESELRALAAEPRSLDSLRAAGPGFVEAIHDGRRSAAAIAPFLGLSA